MEELAGGNGRWWHSVHQSHGDIHHRDVAHNVIVKSLCTKGFSRNGWFAIKRVCVNPKGKSVPKKGQINENSFEINLLSNTTEHENI